MRYVGWLLVASLIAVGAWLTDLPSEFALFILVGKIPFTQIDIPATILLLFWILVVPMIVWVVFGSKTVFWRGVESLGRIHQRSLNRRYRLFSPNRTVLRMIVITLLSYPTDETPQNSPVAPIIRRRFAALPS